MDKPTDNVKG